MDVSKIDPKLVDDLITAMIGLSGTLLGAWISWRATRTQYHIEFIAKQNACLRAILLEMCRNHHGLVLDLDRSIPFYHARVFEFGGTEARLRDIYGQTQKPNTRVYDALFVDLVSSPFGSPLESYYDRIRWLREMKVKYPDGLPRERFVEFIRRLSGAVTFSVDLICRISVHKGVLDESSATLKEEIDEVKITGERSLAIASLHQLKFETLEALIHREPVPAALPPELAKLDPDWFLPWYEAAQGYLRKS